MTYDIGKLTSAGRRDVRARAELRLKRDPTDKKAAEFIEKIDAFEVAHKATNAQDTRDGWHKVDDIQSSDRILIRQGRELARISKLQDHTHSNTDIWRVYVDGRAMGEPYRYIKDAKVAAEKVVAES